MPAQQSRKQSSGVALLPSGRGNGQLGAVAASLTGLSHGWLSFPNFPVRCLQMPML